MNSNRVGVTLSVMCVLVITLGLWIVGMTHDTIPWMSFLLGTLCVFVGLNMADLILLQALDDQFGSYSIAFKKFNELCKTDGFTLFKIAMSVLTVTIYLVLIKG